jgi:RNA polymerase-associated protein CTR9
MFTLHPSLPSPSYPLSSSTQGLADCLRHLLTAFQLQPGHVGVLTHLAHYCLLQGSHERAEALARAALEGAEALPGPAADGPRAEAMTLLARALHAQGRMDEARAEYAKVGTGDTCSGRTC